MIWITLAIEAPDLENEPERTFFHNPLVAVRPVVVMEAQRQSRLLYL